MGKLGSQFATIEMSIRSIVCNAVVCMAKKTGQSLSVCVVVWFARCAVFVVVVVVVCDCENITIKNVLFDVPTISIDSIAIFRFKATNHNHGHQMYTRQRCDCCLLLSSIEKKNTHYTIISESNLLGELCAAKNVK